MPIIFISLNDAFTNKIKEAGFDAKTMKIEEYIPSPDRKTYYVSPANSLCFMDGGIDYALSRNIFPGIEKNVKNVVNQIGKTSIVGKRYLPIGSSIIIDDNENNRALVVAPTMLLPQNISNTKNAYYATMAILYNIIINQKQNLEDVDIIFTSMCCGYGKMDEDTSIYQIIYGIRNYANYKPDKIYKNIVLHEPNLFEQPKYYQNTEFFKINPSDIVHC